MARDGERMRALAGERQALEAKLAVLYSDWERTSTEIEAVENRNRD